MESDEWVDPFGNHWENECKVLLSKGISTPNINNTHYLLRGCLEMMNSERHKLESLTSSPPQTPCSRPSQITFLISEFREPQSSVPFTWEKLNQGHTDWIAGFPFPNDTRIAACSFKATGNDGSDGGVGRFFWTIWGFIGGSDGKNPPARQETWVWSLGREDSLEKGMATHSSILAWEIPWPTKNQTGLSD